MRLINYILILLFLALICQSCNSKHNPYPINNQTPPTQNNPPAPPIPPPPEPVEGRLITNYYAAHPELKALPKPAEPFVPKGNWLTTPKGIKVWAPLWLQRQPDFLNAAFLEIDNTEPRFESDKPSPEIPSGSKGVSPNYPGRVIICDPGSFSARWEGEPDNLPTDTGIYAGYTILKIWPEADGTYSDVMFVAWRTTSSLPLLPALAHELWRTWTRKVF